MVHATKVEEPAKKESVESEKPQSEDAAGDDLKLLQERLTSLPKAERIHEINKLPQSVRQSLHVWVSKQKERAEALRKQTEEATKVTEKGHALRNKLLALPKKERKTAFEDMSADELRAVRTYIQAMKDEGNI